MNERAPVRFRRRVRLLGAVMATALLGGSLIATGTAGLTATNAGAAPTPVVSVTPSTGATASGQAFQVSGSNVSTTANMGFGIYVSFGPDPASLPADWTTNATYFQATAWTHPGGSGSATNKNLEADGTFSFNLTRADGSPLTAVYTTSAGTFDCTQVSCGIVTLTADGVPDRTQDTFTPVTFQAPVPTPAVTASPATGANPFGQAFTVSGSGFNATNVSQAGVYVAFGPDPATLPASPPFYVNAAYYEAMVWTHPGGPGTATNKNMNPDGSFSYTLTKPDGSPLTAVYTTSAGTFDCTQVQCGVLTFRSQGSSDRSQDTFAPVSFTVPPTADPTTATVSVPFNTTVAPFAGVGPYHWSVYAGALPPGLSLNADTGAITGTPTTEGSFKATIRVTDSKSPKPAKASTRVKIRVAPAAMTITPASLPAATAGQPYEQTLSAAGGVGPYTFKRISGTLPPKVKLIDGGFSGVPKAPGTYTFEVQVKDAFKFTATRTYTVVVGS